MRVVNLTGCREHAPRPLQPLPCVCPEHLPGLQGPEEWVLVGALMVRRHLLYGDVTVDAPPGRGRHLAEAVLGAVLPVRVIRYVWYAPCDPYPSQQLRADLDEAMDHAAAGAWGPCQARRHLGLAGLVPAPLHLPAPAR